MPLPVSINMKIARHYLQVIWRNRNNGHANNGRGSLRIPLVLMLELTHACNLKCRGCGRIREYADSQKERLTFDQARAAMIEADTPVVSISGGEPLLHSDAPSIAALAVEMGKVVYFCTNGLLLTRRLAEFEPHRLFFFNVHMDGPPAIHDDLVGLPGTARRALEGIVQARRAGFNVTTNTTVYRSTPPEAIAALFEQLTEMGVKGLMIAPAFAYEVGTEAETFTRPQAQAWFKRLYELWGDRNMTHTPLYMQFLRGERKLTCMPWGTVTYNPQGWKTPCYLLIGDHVSSFRELMDTTDWQAYGPGRDPRCADCMLHSGFEPSVINSIRGLNDGWRSLLRLARWQMGR
ncbi:MAG: adenosyl-hopene transferase HpnH [Anaerolineales bacterium]|nr:adenosyl-hopene transferase HpnH [Anaerolineales bacterium]